MDRVRKVNGDCCHVALTKHAVCFSISLFIDHNVIPLISVPFPRQYASLYQSIFHCTKFVPFFVKFPQIPYRKVSLFYLSATKFTKNLTRKIFVSYEHFCITYDKFLL